MKKFISRIIWLPLLLMVPLAMGLPVAAKACGGGSSSHDHGYQDTAGQMGSGHMGAAGQSGYGHMGSSSQGGQGKVNPGQVGPPVQSSPGTPVPGQTYPSGAGGSDRSDHSGHTSTR